eukprot:847769-Pyramimonas_sp.AAC.1
MCPSRSASLSFPPCPSSFPRGPRALPAPPTSVPPEGWHGRRACSNVSGWETAWRQCAGCLRGRYDATSRPPGGASWR